MTAKKETLNEVCQRLIRLRAEMVAAENIFGLRLADARYAAGMSVRALGLKAKISGQQVWNIENGVHAPSDSFIYCVIENLT